MANEPTDFDFGESPIPPNTFRLFEEITFRKDGHVWRSHKNDADPFPSDPHAHNVESGLKLDLSSGRLWCGTRDTRNSISRKHLIAIRNFAEQNGFVLPALVV